MTKTKGVRMLTNSNKTIPFLNEYFMPYAIQPNLALSMFSAFKRLDMQSHLEAQARHNGDHPGAGEFPVVDGVAIIQLQGTLMKQVSSFGGGTSTVEARRNIRTAMRSSDINSILLLVESPGGSAHGTLELADDVAAAAAIKPTNAFIEDLGASAAVWIFSNATFISANKMALVGSVGTFAVLFDESKAAEMAGVEVVIIKAGEMKGAGTPGTEITTEQRAMFQKEINDLNSQFLAGLVKTGRFNKQSVKAINDGRIHIASEAKKLGFIDKVETFDKAFARIRAEGVKASKNNEASASGGAVPVSVETEGAAMTLSLGTEQFLQIQKILNRNKDFKAAQGATDGYDKIIKSESEFLPIEQPKSESRNGPGDTDTTDTPETESIDMATDDQAQPATIQELKAALPKASAEFIVKQLEAGATVAKASSAYIEMLQTSNEKLTKDKTDADQNAETANNEAADKASGGDGLKEIGDDASAGGGSGSSKSDWDEAINTLMDTRKMSKAAAIRETIASNPALHHAMLTEHNTPFGRKVPDLVM